MYHLIGIVYRIRRYTEVYRPLCMLFFLLDLPLLGKPIKIIKQGALSFVDEKFHVNYCRFKQFFLSLASAQTMLRPPTELTEIKRMAGRSCSGCRRMINDVTTESLALFSG